MVWGQVEPTKAHVAYARVGVFSSMFSVASLFIKEKLYIGESMVVGIIGLIVGFYCLNWFNPITWGNTDSITLEISRIVICLQVFAGAVELPRRYMGKHWLSTTMLLVPVVTSGWLIIGLFIWTLMPGLNFAHSILVASCITATDPVLAQSVVSGKFAQKIPGNIRKLISTESGVNDGLAFPFVYLSLNLITYPKQRGDIIKNWLCITFLWECIFGSILGIIIGYGGRRIIKFAEDFKIIDRESFLAFYVILVFMCAGLGSILGIDDLLTSFFAGTAFAWDGWFSEKTKGSHVSTIISIPLNYAYFLYFDTIIPWQDFNDSRVGLNIWRLIILAIVVISLRRIPAALSLKPLIPDIKSWCEALLVGHFGPISISAVFAALTARARLETQAKPHEETPLRVLPYKSGRHWQIISGIWPMTCFFILTSIIVHDSSVAITTLENHINRIALAKTFVSRSPNRNGTMAWMQKLIYQSYSFSDRPTVENSGITRISESNGDNGKNEVSENVANNEKLNDFRDEKIQSKKEGEMSLVLSTSAHTETGKEIFLSECIKPEELDFTKLILMQGPIKSNFDIIIFGKALNLIGGLDRLIREEESDRIKTIQKEDKEDGEAELSNDPSPTSRKDDTNNFRESGINSDKATELESSRELKDERMCHSLNHPESNELITKNAVDKVVYRSSLSRYGENKRPQIQFSFDNNDNSYGRCLFAKNVKSEHIGLSNILIGIMSAKCKGQRNGAGSSFRCRPNK